MKRMLRGYVLAALLLSGMAAVAFEIDMTGLPQGLSFRPRSRIESYMKDDNFGINEYQRLVGIPHPDPPRPPFSGVQDDVRKALAEFLVNRILADGFVGDPKAEYRDVSSVKFTKVSVDQLGWSKAHKLAVLRCSTPGSVKENNTQRTWEGDFSFVGFIRTDEAGAPMQVLLALGDIEVGHGTDTLQGIINISMVTTFEGEDVFKVILDRESYGGRGNLIVSLLEDGFKIDDIHVDAWD